MTEFEIRQQLRFVHRKNRLDRFDLDENFIFDNEINPVPEIDHDVVIHNGIRFFYLEPHPETPQLVAQTDAIGPLQEAWTEP